MLSRGAPAGGVGLAGAGREARPGDALMPLLPGKTAQLEVLVFCLLLNPTAMCSHGSKRWIKGLW